MADKIYPKFKAQLMRGTSDLQSVALVMRAMLLNAIADGDYTYNDAHEFLSDIPAGARIKATNPLAGKAVNMTTGAFDSDDPTAEAVAGGGDNVNRLVLFVDTGVEGTSRLVFYKDTGISTVPFTPDGSDIRILVHANGWFIL